MFFFCNYARKSWATDWPSGTREFSEHAFCNTVNALRRHVSKGRLQVVGRRGKEGGVYVSALIFSSGGRAALYVYNMYIFVCACTGTCVRVYTAIANGLPFMMHGTVCIEVCIHT